MSVFPPEIMSQRIGNLNFADLAVEMCDKRGVDPVYLNNPDFSESIKREIHRKFGIDWMHGGWMEDRSKIWRGTYLKDTGKFLHLGIDCSVGAGVRVLSIGDGPVVHAGTDSPLEGGWGGHVVQLIRYRGARHALIYAHLGKIVAMPGATHYRGAPIGVVGNKTENGHWSAHLHLQLVANIDEVKDWKKFLDSEMDGYGEVSRRHYWAKRCPDPTPLIW